MEDSESSRLEREFPLSCQWERPSLVRHTTCIGNTRIYLAGLSVADGRGQLVYGSAGQLAGSPLPRAYFELVERTSMVEAFGQAHEYLELHDVHGELAGVARREDVFPESVDEQRWRYARSNGIAVGSDWEDATRRAGLELIERDRVLRSWYGDTIPERLELSSTPVPEALGRDYEFESYLFPAAGVRGDTVTVAGVFGFPRREGVPLVFGLGARHGVQHALVAAASECLQRLGFLWGEAIPGELPPFSPTADFHQEYYLHPPHHAELRSWLAGAHGKFRGVLGLPSSCGETCHFVDLTPEALHSKLVVVKALPADELPLTFGYGHPRLQREVPDQLSIHPIA
jgi:hypothetical protein